MADGPTEEGEPALDDVGARAQVEGAAALPSSALAAASAAADAATAPLLAQAHPELQPDPLAGLFDSIAGTVVVHNRCQFALECWQVKGLGREVRYVEGVTQPGSLAVMVFQCCRLGRVSKLLEEARKRKRDEIGRTQLMRAAMDNDAARMRQLFQLGCPATIVNAQNSVALRLCIMRSCGATRSLCASCLCIVQGADLDAKNRNGRTPLMYSGRRLTVVRVLCDTPGVDQTVCAQGWTALGYALSNNYADVVAVLHAHGAPE